LPAHRIGCKRGENDTEFDVVVYGGTSAGVIAAVQAVKMGKSVVLVSPDKQLGGLNTSGLGWTDTGDRSVIGDFQKILTSCVETLSNRDPWIDINMSLNMTVPGIIAHRSALKGGEWMKIPRYV
jgi:flavin-dependent dehydrogenase